MLLIQTCFAPANHHSNEHLAGASQFSHSGSLCGDQSVRCPSRALLQIPATANCELIKWNLTLYQEPKTLASTNRILGGGTKTPGKKNGQHSGAKERVRRLSFREGFQKVEVFVALSEIPKCFFWKS